MHFTERSIGDTQWWMIPQSHREKVPLGKLCPSICVFLAILGLFFQVVLQNRSLAAEPPNPASATNPTPFKPKPIMVVATNRMQTMMGFIGHREFPYSTGNHVTIEQVKPAPPDGMETHTDLRVVNMLAENLTEILRRLGTETIEIAIYPKTNFVSTFKFRNEPERQVILETGYAVITDTRIPRDWFLSRPYLGNFPTVKADGIMAAFPLSFKPAQTD